MTSQGIRGLAWTLLMAAILYNPLTAADNQVERVAYDTRLGRQSNVVLLGDEKKDPKVLGLEEARVLLREVSSVVVMSAGPNIVIDGTVGTPTAQTRVEMLVNSFDNVINLAVQKDNVEINSIISSEIKDKIGNPNIEVTLLRGNVILSGKVANEFEMQKAESIAKTYSDMIVNNIEVDEKMVEIDLAFVSMSRGDEMDVGGNPFASVNGELDFQGNVRDALRMGRRDLNLTLNTQWIWGIVAEDKNHKILNRPHLTTVTRKRATFHQGGERGYEVVTQDTANVDFKEYGVMVAIFPELTADDKIRCTVTFEVTLPEPGANRLDFTTYKTEATALLMQGQSLVLSGLLRDIREKLNSGVPGLRNIPILNYFVAQRRKVKTQEDLILIVTPSLPSCRTAPAEAYSLEQLRSVPAEAFQLRADDFGRKVRKRELGRKSRNPFAH